MHGRATDWSELHRLSERDASDASVAMASGHPWKARRLYASAAAHEEAALASLGADRPRTWSVTAASAAWLWYKSEDAVALATFAAAALAMPDLLPFARSEILAAASRAMPPTPA